MQFRKRSYNDPLGLVLNRLEASTFHSREFVLSENDLRRAAGGKSKILLSRK